MIIQSILVLFFLILSIYAITQKRRARLVFWVVLVVSLFGIIFTALPQLTTEIARSIGVGRGADLILYVFITIALFVIVNIHLKLRESNEMITNLARAISLSSARKPNK